jgi:hypothetical protein
MNYLCVKNHYLNGGVLSGAKIAIFTEGKVYDVDTSCHPHLVLTDDFGNKSAWTATKEFYTHFRELEEGAVKVDKNLLNTLVSSYETSRQTIKSLIDPDSIMKVKTTQELATQLEFLAKVIVAERELTDQFINDLKELTK